MPRDAKLRSPREDQSMERTGRYFVPDHAPLRGTKWRNPKPDDDSRGNCSLHCRLATKSPGLRHGRWPATHCWPVKCLQECNASMMQPFARVRSQVVRTHVAAHCPLFTTVKIERSRRAHDATCQRSCLLRHRATRYASVNMGGYGAGTWFESS